MSLETIIQNASARNTELLHTLHETESAIPDLASQKRYIVDLERQRTESVDRLRALAETRKREFREHESYRRSIMKRFAYKVGGRTEQFEARAAKEEREYFDALQREHQADVVRRGLEAMLEDARAVHDGLAARAEAYRTAQEELDHLYEAIFTGPSPGFPEEDRREAEVRDAVLSYHDLRGKTEEEVQVIKILRQAQRRLREALGSMGEARQATFNDMIGGGGTFNDMIERNALSTAETQFEQARMLVDQAARIADGSVLELPPVRISPAGLMADVFFDDFHSDVSVREQIQQSSKEVEKCVHTVDEYLVSSKTRLRRISEWADVKGIEVQEARLRLQNARAAAFARIAGGQPAHPSHSETEDIPPEVPPPDYTARGESGSVRNSITTSQAGQISSVLAVPPLEVPPPSYMTRGNLVASANWWET